MSTIDYGNMPQPQGEQLPANVAQLLGGAQQQPDAAPDPLGALQDAIHAVAAALSALPDAQDTQDATQAMLTLAKIQTRLMSAQQQGPR